MQAALPRPERRVARSPRRATRRRAGAFRARARRPRQLEGVRRSAERRGVRAPLRLVLRTAAAGRRRRGLDLRELLPRAALVQSVRALQQARRRSAPATSTSASRCAPVTSSKDSARPVQHDGRAAEGVVRRPRDARSRSAPAELSEALDQQTATAGCCRSSAARRPTCMPVFEAIATARRACATRRCAPVPGATANVAVRDRLRRATSGAHAACRR